MPIFVGVQPGGTGNFAVCALFWERQLPALVVKAGSYSGVDEVLNDIMGISGEWGPMGNLAIAAPLTWSGSPSGWRKCDRILLKQLPAWAPKSWLRAPNSLPGAISVQGPALTWALARETKLGQLAAHGVVETMPRLCLAQVAADLKTAVLDYRRREVAASTRRDHVRRLLQRLVEPGFVKIEQDKLETADALDALVCALVALASAVPEAGLVVSELAGGDIRPVGRRSVAILQAFP